MVTTDLLSSINMILGSMNFEKKNQYFFHIIGSPYIILLKKTNEWVYICTIICPFKSLVKSRHQEILKKKIEIFFSHYRLPLYNFVKDRRMGEYLYDYLSF